MRSIVSIDPAILKANRQGSVMARGQMLWNDGALTMLYSPKLAEQASGAGFAFNAGATNNRDRWLIAASQQLGDSINPQVLVYGEENRSPQLGINLTRLVNESTVAYIEWSGGRSPSLLTQALGQPDDSAFRNRVSIGSTYTTAYKLSLMVEYEYNGAALDKAGWNALRRGAVTDYARYRAWVQNQQELPTRQAVFRKRPFNHVLAALSGIRHDVSAYQEGHRWKTNHSNCSRTMSSPAAVMAAAITTVRSNRH